MTATDSGGLSSTQTQQLLPRTVNLTFVTQPAGRTIVMIGRNGMPDGDPAIICALVVALERGSQP